MDEQGNEAAVAESSEKAKDVRPARLSLHMIVKRHLPKEAETWTQEQVIKSLNEITHLRLDRENIGEIDSLELLGTKLTNVYLQQNRITCIQNLDCLQNLQFITLAGNRIRTVDNLRHLNCLLFLDLSDNDIQHFDIDEFPQSLIILNLKGNPCCNRQDYRGSIIQELSNLKQLDGEDISKMEKLEVGFQISSEEEGDDEEIDFEDNEDVASTRTGAAQSRPTLSTGRSKLPDIEVRLQDLTSEMLLRSQNRLEDSLQIHRRHIMEMNTLRIQNKSGQNPPAQ